MASLPRATTVLSPTSSVPGQGDDLICVLAPVPTLADMVPRLYGSAAAVFADHGYSEGVEYVALHTAGTGKSVIFVGMPIGTAGAVSRSTGFGNTGSSVVAATAGGSGVLGEHDGVVLVLAGGTIGTDQIQLGLSLDGGVSYQNVRLGTASSYVIPYVGVTLSFAAGTLVAGDEALSWHGSAPIVSNSDLTTALANLASQLQFFRDTILIGDLPNSTAANSYASVLNSYASAHDRFIYGRASVYDRLPQAFMSHSYGRMTGSPSLTFAEVGGTGDTVTRATGSWLVDGYVAGDTVSFTGTVSNNVTGPITAVTDTVLTFGSTDLAAEVTAAASSTSSPTLTFAEVGATGDTVTRSRGSWLVDGFRVGDDVTFAGTVSNNVTTDGLTAVTALVLTLNTTDLAAESIGSALVTAQSGGSKAQWVAGLNTAFASVDGQPRIDLSAGRGRVLSPFSGWIFRRPAGWAASLREYVHDLHIPTWRKADGPTGFDLFDDAGNLVEWDDRVDGGAASAARFTSFRTWSNGPAGAFITQSLTRAGDGQITSLTHNMAVVNAGCNAVQQATENVIGRVLRLNADGTATKDSLAVIAGEVNAAVDLVLLSARGEGPRVSSAKWAPDPADVYNVPEPVMHGTLDINLNGTIFSVATQVRVLTNGQ